MCKILTHQCSIVCFNHYETLITLLKMNGTASDDMENMVLGMGCYTGVSLPQIQAQYFVFVCNTPFYISRK